MIVEKVCNHACLYCMSTVGFLTAFIKRLFLLLNINVKATWTEIIVVTWRVRPNRFEFLDYDVMAESVSPSS